MGKKFYKTTASILIFTLGIIVSVFSQYFPESLGLRWILLSVAIFYFVLGWFLFKAYYPQGHPLLLFAMGYFYSGVFISSVFASAKWPFAKTVMAGSIFWITLQTLFVFILRKKMPGKGFIRFLSEAGLMLVLTLLHYVIIDLGLLGW